MSAELAIRHLASADPTLQGYLGTNPFRWFDRQAVQKSFSKTTPVVRYRRISTMPRFNFTSLMSLQDIRLQIEVLHVDGEQARTIAEAIVNFMSTGVDLTSPNQFGSPPTLNQFKRVYLQNWISGSDSQIDPQAMIELLDFRIPNRTDLTA